MTSSMTTIDESAFAQSIERYFELRAHWSKIHNLSGPDALCDVETDKQDSLAVARIALPECPLVDVGSGNGIPGLLVALLRPDLQVLLVEPRVKRVAFLRSAASELALKNVSILRERWPAALPAAFQDPIQLVSRAVVDPASWPALALSTEAPVAALLRMLALQRPAFDDARFEQDATYNYSIAGHGERCVERWIARKEAP